MQEGANAESFQAGMDVLENEAKIIRAPVSYTHLDVYKRQAFNW